MTPTDGEKTKKGIDPKKRVRPNLWLVIALLAGSCLFLIAIFGSNGLMRWLQSDQEKKSLTAELEKIEEQNARIRREIDALMHNGKYIETIARRDLGMVKADEIIYQFLPGGKKADTAQPVPADR